MPEQLFPELEVDPRKKIADYVARYRIKQTLLSDALNVSPNHVKEILKCRRSLTEDARKKINEALNTNF